MGELGGADLGDARRTDRAVDLVGELAARPGESIPDALSTWARTKAAYRFFDNPNVGPGAILKAHRSSALRRAAGRPFVLAVQDATSLNFTSRPAMGGGAHW